MALQEVSYQVPLAHCLSRLTERQMPTGHKGPRLHRAFFSGIPACRVASELLTWPDWRPKGVLPQQSARGLAAPGISCSLW